MAANLTGGNHKSRILEGEGDRSKALVTLSIIPVYDDINITLEMYIYIYSRWWISFVFAFHPSSTAVSSRSYYSVPLACNRKNNVVFERLDVSYYLLTLPFLIFFSFFPFFPPPPPRSCRDTKRNFVPFRGNSKRHEKEVTSLILLCLEGGGQWSWERPYLLRWILSSIFADSCFLRW